MTEYEWRNHRPTKKKGVESEEERRVSDEIRSSCRIYFPSYETVHTSRGGVGVSDAKVLSRPRASQVDARPGRWNYLLPTKILGVRLLSARSHAGLQKPKRGLINA
jgi:hypothetical protein